MSHPCCELPNFSSALSCSSRVSSVASCDDRASDLLAGKSSKIYYRMAMTRMNFNSPSSMLDPRYCEQLAHDQFVAVVVADFYLSATEAEHPSPASAASD
jgi:hypothetical protein